MPKEKTSKKNAESAAKRAKKPDHRCNDGRGEPAPASLRPGAGDARERILEVSGAMLREVGPDGMRLQEIARQVGVSHPAILHHFGSRAGLVHAVVERAISALEADIVQSLSGGEALSDPAALIERVFRAFSEHGHARLIAWLSLSRFENQEATSKMGDIAELVHAMRKSRLHAEGLKCPPFEDTASVVMLACYALLGEAICGPTVRTGAKLGGKDPDGVRFRRWLADRLVQHLETPSPAK
jgi:AcrR family transcriptional regulator